MEWCDTCGRLKTEYRAAGTVGPFCWWCNERAASTEEVPA